MRLHEMYCPRCRSRWYWIKTDNIPPYDKVPWLQCIRCEIGETPPQPPPPIAGPFVASIIANVITSFVSPEIGRKRRKGRKRRNP